MVSENGIFTDMTTKAISVETHAGVVTDDATSARYKNTHFLEFSEKYTFDNLPENKVTKFSVNPNTSDPYKDFRFLLWDGKYVAGFNKMSPLKKTSEGMKYSEGNSTGTLIPDKMKYEAIILERGVTYDARFEKWMNSGPYLGQGHGFLAESFKKDLIIEVNNERGMLALSYEIYDCLVSQYQRIPLDTNSNVMGIYHLKLNCEGWKRL